MRGHRHDRAGPVAAQHVWRGPDRQPLNGCTAREPRSMPTLKSGSPVGGGRRLRHALTSPSRSARHELLELGMVGADDQERRAEQRVRTRGEDGDVLAPAALEVEEDRRALAPPDPVALHRLRGLGPVQRVQRVEQRLRVARDLQPPLAQVPRLDHRVAALAAPVLDLLVGEHGEARGAPVHRAVAPLGEAGLEQPEEQPLRPAVVGRVGGVDLVAPVEHRADPLELVLAEVGHRATHHHGGCSPIFSA